MEYKAFLSTWCKTFLHTREKEVFFLNTLKIPLAETHQEGPFQVMFVGTPQQKKQNTLNTRKRKGKDTTKITSAPAESCIQFPWSVCLCLALMNLLLGVVPHSSSLVTMALPMTHWDVTSDFLSQMRDSPVWITIRDFLLPPDMLAMRTAGPKWNHAKLCGFFAALWFFLMENGESEKEESESLPEWPSLWCNLRQRFGYYESDRWPLDDDWLLEDYYEALALL